MCHLYYIFYINIQKYDRGVKRYPYVCFYSAQKSGNPLDISHVYDIGKVGHERPSLLGRYNKKRNIARAEAKRRELQRAVCAVARGYAL